MARYDNILIVKGQNDPKRRYINVKYPNIPLGPQDIYVYTSLGDRYDVMALNYYKDSSLWWIINRANPNQGAGSLFPTIGSQIRIPSSNRVASLISAYEVLNLQN